MEEIEKKAGAFVDGLYVIGPGLQTYCYDDVYDAYLAGAREALEMAAKEAIEAGKSVKGGYSNAAFEIAQRIRSLLES